MFANGAWTWIERNIDERGNVRGLCMVDRPDRRAVRGSSGCSSLREG